MTKGPKLKGTQSEKAMAAADKQEAGDLFMFQAKEEKNPFISHY